VSVSHVAFVRKTAKLARIAPSLRKGTLDMQMKLWARSACAWLATAALLFQPAVLAAQDQKNEDDSKTLVEIAPGSSGALAQWAN